ncbi:histone H3, embryonic [Panaeolus papilionaceus]|nr:histone H3, embryonic [Panaeolus papilionaceus]
MRANRFRPSPEALQKTRAYRGRNQTKGRAAIIREKPFKRLIKSALDEYQSNLRIQNSAFKLLQSAAESYLAHLFEDTNSVTLHSKRRSIKTEDIIIARMLRGEK